MSVTDAGYLAAVGRLATKTRAFAGCSRLVTLDLPDTLTSIGASAFQGCTSLVTLDLPDTLTSIGAYAFTECTSLTTLDLPDTLTSIGKFAFERCTSLATLDLPDTLTSIGDGAFSGCTGVRRVLLPDALALKIAASEVFEGCPVLAGKGITLHSDVRLVKNELRQCHHGTLNGMIALHYGCCAILAQTLRKPRANFAPYEELR